MKKRKLLPAVFGLCIVLSTACGKADEEIENAPEDTSGAVIGEEEPAAPVPSEDKLLEEQREAYADSIGELDQMLFENRELTGNRGQESDGGIYWEEINTIYMFSESYYGVLRAEYGEGKTDAFQMVMRDGEKSEKHKYECRLLSDGSLWFSFQTESKSEKDLPDYIVNEDALRYGRVDYVYDDGRTDIEEEKELRKQEIEQYLKKDIGGEAQEFWCGGDFLYRIDRKEKLFVDAAEDKESCIAAFLREQARRIDCQLPVSEASLDIVERYKPEGYSLLWERNGWNDIAVNDLNHDGRMDYVAALYPDDYEEEKRYEGFSPYELSPQYYAAGFWLLLSSEDGGYEQIRLSGSIEYRDTALVLTEVTFVDEGILQLEYFVGRSPFSNALLRFQYDEEEKEFYILRSYFRDLDDDSLMIAGVENYGRTNMMWYFADMPQNYYDEVWESAKEIYLQEGILLGYYSDSFQYRCENPLEKHHINSLIWEKEYELVEALVRHYADKELDISLYTDPVFYNQRLVSGRVELFWYEDSGKKTVWMPIMVDKRNGGYATVTKLLEKEEFLRIFADWSEDALNQEIITLEDKEWYVESIEKSWEEADTMENYLGEGRATLFLQIVQEGVKVGVWPNTDVRRRCCTIDKEYFWGTEVWDYFGMRDVMEE